MTALVIPDHFPAVLPLDVRNAIEATGHPARCTACCHPTLLHFAPARKPWACIPRCGCAGLHHPALVEHVTAWLARRPTRPSIPLAVSRAVIARDGMTCRYCGRRVHRRRRGPGRLHLDHVRPYSLGGLAVVDNLVVACLRCNLDKGADPSIVPRLLEVSAP